LNHVRAKHQSDAVQNRTPTLFFWPGSEPRPPTKLIDPKGRSSIYVPITQNGKVVDSQGFMLDPEDERPCPA